MFEIGRLCVKIAGRDSGNKCVIVDVIDKNFVIIDGNVRRKKCNIKHLEPLDKVLKLNKGASHEEVSAEFKKLKLDVWKTKPKEKTEKPKKQRIKRKRAMKSAIAEQKPKKVKKAKKKTPEKTETKKEEVKESPKEKKLE